MGAATSRDTAGGRECLDPGRFSRALRVWKTARRKISGKSAHKSHLHLPDLRDESAKLAKGKTVLKCQDALRFREHGVNRRGHDEGGERCLRSDPRTYAGL